MAPCYAGARGSAMARASRTIPSYENAFSEQPILDHLLGLRFPELEKPRPEALVAGRRKRLAGVTEHISSTLNYPWSKEFLDAELSPRKLAVTFTEREGYCLPPAQGHDLITSPAFGGGVSRTAKLGSLQKHAVPVRGGIPYASAYS